MRAILCISLFLFGAFWAACQWHISPGKQTHIAQAEKQTLEDHWVRTRNGWEKTSDWVTHTQPWQPTLHPGIVASLQILVTLLAFIVIDGKPNAEKEELTQTER